MIRVGLVGLGKMGISHQAILNAHPDLELAAVCDTTGYLLSVMHRFTGVSTYTDYGTMLDKAELDAVVIATPPDSHVFLVEKALERGLHVFCEKPFALDPADGLRLAEKAEAAGVVNQVGYHYRFVGSFVYLKHLLDIGAIGQVHHVQSEAYGPVVLRAKTATWRSAKGGGGGSLYDYASHVVDLVNFCFGRPDFIRGAVMHSIFSAQVDDEVYATLGYNDGKSVQLSVNWSDESQRKMSAKLSVWGTRGKIVADRQGLQLFLREPFAPENLTQGWTVRYTTDLTEPVDFYLRGEEYSAQIDHFAKAILAGDTATRSTFRSSVETDQIVDAIRSESQRPPTLIEGAVAATAAPAAPSRKGIIGRLLGPAR
ncbi:hypothetical protein GCM10009087_41190 [Sphingomonas oligophenolica]|uniref:Gfo/Idh/MocA family oxidoreductase n=1 Tax=Sphingomonas oligophenolica TaxID=301154 RepID=A0ABU9YCP9_9SPHN